MTVAYLAAAGYRRPLQEELERAGLGPALRWFDERLVLCDAPAVDAAWAVNTWFDVEELAVRSIADAAAQLRDRQRSWCAYPPGVGGRAALISARLPHVSGRALQLGEPAPASPLGSWTLATPQRLLAAVSRGAVTELGLEPGRAVYALVKTVSIDAPAGGRMLLDP